MTSRSKTTSTVRPLLGFAATATVLGIAFSASGGEELGSYVSVAGALIFIYALHSFGRTGPDEY
ncbi:MAG TPA: hypothetical protein VK524_05920 [Polyangiaceae bacterium]|nr:hypothetical protein [Polyangiaceae bacterium]